MSDRKLSKLTDDIIKYASVSEKNSKIDSSLYEKYEVKQGLRDKNGEGVVTGLTNISEIHAKKKVDGKLVPCPGELFYRGIDIHDIIAGCSGEDRWGFEEVVFLLLMGQLPTRDDYGWICGKLREYRSLPTSFVRDIIMKSPSENIMNSLARSVLTLYSYDDRAEDLSLPNILRQSLELIALLPLLAVYGYQTHCYYNNKESLVIRPPKEELSTAENILQMLRPDGRFTSLEAHVLDVALVLHAEHGGGNNSSFTTRVVSTSGTDTYSAIAAGLCSLKGPKHGGANIKVTEMFRDMKEHVSDWSDDGQIEAYLSDVLDRKAFDKAGLIYGIGHAVYSVSDPRAEIFKTFVKELSEQKGLQAEYGLYSKVAEIAPKLISQRCRMYKGVSPNIDFYSGFVYQMMGLPKELFTPIFAIARVVGWSAHRMEELECAGKIIRPAYKAIGERREYSPIDDR